MDRRYVGVRNDYCIDKITTILENEQKYGTQNWIEFQDISIRDTNVNWNDL